jgi:phosphatidylglycerol---prolipoprotein diacylglyceryl transferase
MIFSIDWNMSAELIPGWSTPNLYGLLFVSGIIIGYFVMKKLFKKEGIPETHLEKLLMYIVIATIVGARLGHVIFYGQWWNEGEGLLQTRGYFSNPIDIFKVWEGGLASHGAAVAIFLALLIYTKYVSKKSLIWILDRVAAPIAVACCFIRLGNLVNHEIVGDPTTLPWGFIFNNEEEANLIEGVHVARHPAQLYEAICYILLFFFLYFLVFKKKMLDQPGKVFGLFLVILFTCRFFIEFIKEGQTERDFTMAINTGQMLSIPFVLAGLICIFYPFKKQINETLTHN